MRDVVDESCTKPEFLMPFFASPTSLYIELGLKFESHFSIAISSRIVVNI